MPASRWTLLAALLALLGAGAVRAEEKPDVAKLAETFVSGEDAGARVKAGLTLGRSFPLDLAKALDRVVKAKGEGDPSVLATCAVRTKCRHVRLLFVWAASKLEGAAAAFLDQIDFDHLVESRRAVECLGFLRDHAAYDRLVTLCRDEDELIAVQAARALGRVGTSRDAGDLAEACLEVDNSHVRLHMAWAVQDLTGSRKRAMGLFGRFLGRKGTIRHRAKEAAAALEDELAKPESYRVKLDEVRKYFKRLREPPVESSDKDAAKRVRAALAEMAKKAPDWYHLVCSTVKEIQVAGDQKLFEFRPRILKLQFSDMVRWDRQELIEYYLVRFATIMFLQQMGDPSEGHRGWEEGIAEAWWYAWDHTQIAVDEDLSVFMKGALKKRPW